MKIYKTFEEIDRDMRILRLQSKIEREEIKINIADIKEDFSPAAMAGDIVGTFAKKAMLLKGVSSFVGFLKKR